MKPIFFAALFLIANVFVLYGQSDQSNRANYPQTQIDAFQNISQDISKISKSVQSLNASVKDILEKMQAGKGNQLSEKQQKILLGFEILNRAEQRLEILQKFQIELTQKDGEIKTRMSQVEEDLFPGGIERSVAVIGTTKGEEVRENRRRTLETERRSLQILSAQITRNLQQTNEELRQAENLVQTLRRKILPQIESEISDL